MRAASSRGCASLQASVRSTSPIELPRASRVRSPRRSRRSRSPGLYAERKAPTPTRTPRLLRRMTIHTRLGPMRFEKWQALGNDYLIVERAELPFELTPARIRKLCEGHFGVFADGILLLSPSDDPRFVAQLRIYNPDGSEAELSGNGAREAILYLRRRGWTDSDTFAISTAAGDIRPTITGPYTCSVEMGRASLRSSDFPGGPYDGPGANE